MVKIGFSIGYSIMSKLGFVRTRKEGGATIPELISISVAEANPTKINIVYDTSLSDEVPNISAFSVTGKTLTGVVEISGSTAILTTTVSFYNGESATLVYTQPEANPLKTTQGGKAESFSQSITNNTTTLSSPTNFAVTWTNDYAAMSVDAIPGDTQMEWYESKNGGAYTLVTTTAVGIASYNNSTWQNESMAFKCRKKKDSYYSAYTSVQSLSTPLTFKVTVATPSTWTFNSYTQIAGTVGCNWGDGNSENFTTSGNKTHNYGVGTFYLQLTNANLIRQMYSTGALEVGTNASKWVLPPLTLLRAEYLIGDISSWVLPSALGSVNVEGGTKVNVPSGDLSSLLMPTAMTAWNCRNTNFTDFTRGHYKSLSGAFGWRWDNNSISTAKIAAWLTWLNTYYDTNAPTATLTMNISGGGMGIVAGGANNQDVIDIKKHFTDAGKVLTFTLNAG